MVVDRFKRGQDHQKDKSLWGQTPTFHPTASKTRRVVRERNTTASCHDTADRSPSRPKDRDAAVEDEDAHGGS